MGIFKSKRKGYGYGQSWCVTYLYKAQPGHQTFAGDDYDHAHGVAKNLLDGGDTNVTNVRFYKEVDI
jgi:hypothetical protein